MNWSKNSSIELSRICVVLFMILLAALDIGCYWAVQWFVEIRLMYWQYGVLMMVTIYLCSGFGWVLLVRLWQLLQNIRYDRYVLPQSVRDKGMEARYRSAFELAGQAAAQLRDRGADESALCYLMLSGQTVPVLTTMNARGLAGVVPPLWSDLLLHRQMPRRQNDLRSPGRNEAEIQRIKRTARRNGWPNKTDNRHSGIIRCACSCII